MVDIDMNILNNPDLGQNSHLPFLDETEAQLTENRRAEAEGRLPRRILPRERFGIYAGSTEVGPLEFANQDPENDAKTEEEYFTNQEMEREAEEKLRQEEGSSENNSDETLNNLMNEYENKDSENE